MATSAPKAVPKIVPAASGEAAPAPKSKKKLFLIIGLLLLAIGGGAAWYFLGYAKSEASVDAKPVAPAPVFLVLDQFTVNLQSDGFDQFLQTSLTLQVAEQEDVDAIKLYMPEVRNRLLMLLSGKSSSEILTLDGKKKLADEIVAALKKPFVTGAKPQQVTNVFFTSFVVQ